MSPKKPETPEEQWAAIQATVAESEARALDDMTDEEVDAELAAQGFDVAKVKRDGEAFAASLLAELDAAEGKAPTGVKASAPSRPAEPPKASEPPSNVVAFPSKRSRAARWSVMLIAAAIAATLAITTAMTIARRDPPPPTPKAPEPEVLVDEHAKEIAELRSSAEGLLQAKDWRGCLAALRHADSLMTNPPDAPDGLRQRCVDEAVTSLRAAALESAKQRKWLECASYFQQAAGLSGDPDAGGGVIRETCEKKAEEEEHRVKAP